MNKNSLFLYSTLVFLLIGNYHATAQTSYRFEKRTETYVKLRSIRIPNGMMGTEINGKAWNGFGSSISPDFSLKFFGDTVGTPSIQVTNERIQQGDTVEQTSAVSFYPYVSNSSICDRNYDKSKKLEDQPSAISSVSYIIDGQPGKRILKIEFNNVKLLTASKEDSLFMQYWYYEEDQTVEFRYGPSYMVNPTGYRFVIGMFNFDNIADTTLEGLYLAGNPDNPTLVRDDKTYGNNYLTRFPANGTVYRFTLNKTNNISDKAMSSLQVYPNPANERVMVQFSATAPGAKLSLLDITGRTVLQEEVNSLKTQLDVSGQAPGLYLLQVNNGKETALQRLIIQ